jgi:hypothetical protein
MTSFWISHLREFQGDEVIQKAAAVAWILMNIVEHAHGGWEFRLHLLTDGQCREDVTMVQILVPSTMTMLVL